MRGGGRAGGLKIENSGNEVSGEASRKMGVNYYNFKLNRLFQP